MPRIKPGDLRRAQLWEESRHQRELLRALSLEPHEMTAAQREYLEDLHLDALRDGATPCDS
jgi:hypothetical protein